jgi:hypothetical protein
MEDSVLIHGIAQLNVGSLLTKSVNEMQWI